MITRDRLVAAALQCFSERTVEGTPVPLIAGRAGVATGTLYRHFEGKEALANACFRVAKNALGDAIAPALAADVPAREAFHAIWRGLWQFAVKHPAALRFLETHHHEAYLDDESRSTRSAVFDGIRGFVERAQARGEIRPGDGGLLIALAFGAFVGAVKEADQGHLALDDAGIAEAEQAVWAMLAATED